MIIIDFTKQDLQRSYFLSVNLNYINDNIFLQTLYAVAMNFFFQKYNWPLQMSIHSKVLSNRKGKQGRAKFDCE